VNGTPLTFTLGIDVKRCCRIDAYSFWSNLGGMIMKTTLLIRVGAIAFGSMSLLWMGSVNAAHPASVAGNWAVTGNQSLGALVIAQPASAAVCKPISGTIFGSTIQGYYCPVTGRIVFARRAGFGAAFPFFQLYEAHVSRDGVVDRIGGSFLIWNAGGGGFANEGVDFNFSATK
jgi:hypothetical protein